VCFFCPLKRQKKCFSECCKRSTLPAKPHLEGARVPGGGGLYLRTAWRRDPRRAQNQSSYPCMPFILMVPFVIDASATLPWCFDEAGAEDFCAQIV
jgi:hypothetical protein